jgi:hypothetical protein
MNATFVLWKREIKKAFAKKFVLLLEILLIVGVVILLKMVNKANFFKGVDYATFFAPGVIALAIAAYSLTSGWNVIEEKASAKRAYGFACKQERHVYGKSSRNCYSNFVKGFFDNSCPIFSCQISHRFLFFACGFCCLAYTFVYKYGSALFLFVWA